MFMSAIILLSLLLQGCSNYPSRYDSDDTSYFSDASNCYRSSERKVQVKVPTALTMTVIEVPTGNDANVFGQCMEHAGHPVPKADPDDYLNVSRACMQRAHDSSNFDDAYAKCVRYGKIIVETIAPDKPK